MTFRAILIYCLLVLTTLIVNPVLAAKYLRLPLAERWALNNEPGVLAAKAQARAAIATSKAARSLPNPQLELGILNLPVGSYDFHQEPMTQKQIAIRQTLPPRGSRQASQQQWTSTAESYQFISDDRQRQVLRDIRHAWLESHYWQHVQAIVKENQQLFSQLVKVARSQYAVGRQNQQVLLAAKLELSRLDERLVQIDMQKHHSRTAMIQWLGLERGSLPLAGDWPEWQLIMPLSELEQRLLDHPRLAAALSRVSAADAAINKARAQLKPAVSLGFRYGQREDDLLGLPRDDFLSFTVSLDMPLFTRKQQTQAVSAAQYQRAASVNERDELLRYLQSQLQTRHMHWLQLQQRIELYSQTILQQSKAQAQAALHAYQNSTLGFSDVMRAYIADLETQMAYVRLKTDKDKTFAELDYLTALNPFSMEHTHAQ